MEQVYVCGGRLGDFIHTLVVIHNIWKTTGKKGKLYITEDRKFGGDVDVDDKSHKDVPEKRTKARW